MHFLKGLTHAFGQKMEFFSLFVSVKIRLEIMFNNVPDRKETIFSHTKFSLSKSHKSHFFHAFGQKILFLLLLFSVKIRLEIMFNNVLDRKETFFGH